MANKVRYLASDGRGEICCCVAVRSVRGTGARRDRERTRGVPRLGNTCVVTTPPGSEAWDLARIQPDRMQLSSPATQALLIHSWLLKFGTENDYHNVEQEVSRWTGIAS